jgi:hypothetical protein
MEIPIYAGVDEDDPHLAIPGAKLASIIAELGTLASANAMLLESTTPRESLCQTKEVFHANGNRRCSVRSRRFCTGRR